MKTLYYLVIGILLFLLLPMIPFIILKLGMMILHLFSVSEKKAKKDLNQIVFDKYDNAWTVVKATRFFNEGNMNPNMFHMLLRANKSPYIEFEIYWDAKLKQARQNFSDETYTLESQYQAALDYYLFLERLNESLSPEAEVAYLDYWWLKLRVSDDKTKDELRQLVAKSASLLKQHKEMISNQVTILFVSPNEPDGLYSSTFSYNQKGTPYYLEINRLSENGSAHIVLDKAYTFLKPKLKAEMADHDLQHVVLSLWVNQENIRQFYGAFEVTRPKVEGDQRYGMQAYQGIMLYHYDMDTHDINFYQFISAENDMMKDLEKINSQLPEQYQKP